MSTDKKYTVRVFIASEYRKSSEIKNGASAYLLLYKDGTCKSFSKGGILNTSNTRCKLLALWSALLRLDKNERPLIVCNSMSLKNLVLEKSFSFNENADLKTWIVNEARKFSYIDARTPVGATEKSYLEEVLINAKACADDYEASHGIQKKENLMAWAINEAYKDFEKKTGQRATMW